ncbi:hypothetical protein [Brevundimonas aurantiaca]|uniref:hypothetical protein n=1 Tax=Brevundimonas aurantiaca TaxID=74316 RepID=UPI001CD1D5F7|nr:hypothetical protein [Brevundimonas aurantiaca]
MTRLSFLPLALLAGAALGLSACVGGPGSLGGEPPLTPASRYALQVETGLDRIALAVHDDGLSANQNAALAALVERFAPPAPVLSRSRRRPGAIRSPPRPPTPCATPWRA